MLTLLKNKIGNYNSNIDRFNYLREHLQLLILRILDEQGFFQNLSFVGGTALRILYDLNRFSEDLDFCLIEKKNYSFANVIERIEYQLKLENIQVETRYKDHKTVASAFIKFNNLLYELGLSTLKDQKINIKFEVDQNPPTGYKTSLSIINKDFLVAINHFDLPSLFAGKLHALLCRKYVKGRDYYDFLWYVGKKIKPNYVFLDQAILQTENKQVSLDAMGLSQLLIDIFESVDFEAIKEDIKPFLADPKELRLFQKDYFLNLATEFSRV